MMAFENILIVGDSWGAGEFDNNSFQTPSHPGLSHFLSDSYKVKNLSRPRSSLWQLCYTLESYLDRMGPDDNTLYIVVQTDAMRRKCADVYNIDYAECVDQAHNLLHLYQILFERFYYKLQDVCSKYSIRTHLVGGPCDVLCSSWIDVIDQHIHKNHTGKQSEPHIIPVHMIFDHLTKLRAYNRPNLVDDAIDYMDKTFLFNQKLVESKYFGPVRGDFHPSRHGHELMAEYIKAKLEETK
jgi:hypothetical protein